MSEQYILLYSKQCVHSQNLIKSMYKDQDLYKRVYKQCIDEPGVVIPKNIKVVPALIIKSDNTYKTLEGTEVFNWLEQKKKTFLPGGNKSFISTKDNGDIESYDPITMNSGSMSDCFSSISDTRPMSHCYQFIDNNKGFTKTNVNGMVTPSEDDLTSIKSDTSNRLEQLIAQRNLEVQQPTHRR